tara:strand:- start:305 stop:1873 length:1569 start_codon:yes stop_codon:yes gene_type:complete
MKKIFIIFLIIIFKVEISFSQVKYADQFIKLEGCGYGFSAYMDLQKKILDLSGPGIYSGRYKIKYDGPNYIETRGKFLDSGYPVYRISKRTGIIEQLNAVSKASSKVFCAQVNRELTNYGKELAKKEKERKELKKNKPKTVAKKPETNQIPNIDRSQWKLIRNSKPNQPLEFVFFSNNTCQVTDGINITNNCDWVQRYNLLEVAIERGSFYGGLYNLELLGQINLRGLYTSFDNKEKSNVTGQAIKIKSWLPIKDKTIVAKKPETNKPEKNIKSKKPKEKIITTPDIDSSLITIGSGSGFYINNKGYALTNNHVIDICKQSIAVIDGKETLFRVIATDKTNDVAVLKTDYKSRNFIKINEDGAKLGENVIAVGYPLAGRLSDSVKITRGVVSSLSGLDNNIGQIQIDAALQPGNSGGPVLNENGELVGIASAGLNKLLMAKEAKYIPENVNFAVASPIVVNILKSKKVKYTKPGMFSGSYSNTELAELGDSSTIQLFCRNTRAEYARLKKSKKYSQILLDID